MKSKYVIVDGTFAITFGEYYKHDQFSRHGEITSAGFFSIGKDRKVHTYGESLSLKLKPEASDAYFIEKALGLAE